MLKGLASKVLNSILDDYVEGFQDKIVDFTFSGELQLKDLTIKKSILDRFYLPVQLKQGAIGKMTLNVPWTDLTSKPTIIYIEDMFFLVTPKDMNKIDEKEEARINHLKKMDKLDMAEAMKSQSNAKSNASDSFPTQLASKLVSNLQINVKYLHFRYEDDRSSSKPFSMGITLEELHGHTTDSFWNKNLMEPSEIMYRLLFLKNLSVYWNSGDKFLYYTTRAQFYTVMRNFIPCTNNNINTLNYLLPPITCSLKLQLNNKKAPDLVIPKFDAHLQLPTVSLRLAQSQYYDMILLQKSFTTWTKGCRFRSLIPKKLPQEDPLGWWSFACRAVTTTIQQKRNQWEWITMQRRIHDRVTYVALYKKQKQGKECSKQEEEIIDILNHKLTFEDLLYFRTLAEVQIRQEKKGASTPRKSKSFLKDILSRKDSEKSFTNKAFSLFGVNQIELTNADWSELYAAIEYDEQSILKPPPNWIKYRVRLLLSSGSITLLKPRESEERPFVQLSFQNLFYHVDIRPTWHSINSSLERIELHDFLNDHTVFPKIVSPLVQSSNDPLFALNIQIKPIGQVDYIIECSMKPLNVFYNKTFIDALVKFFNEPWTKYHGHTISNMSLSDDTERYRYLIEHQPTFSLKLNLHAPNIIVVEDYNDKASVAIAMILGRLLVETKLTDAIGGDTIITSPRSSGDTVITSPRYSGDTAITSPRAAKNIYDIFNVQMKHLQLSITTADKIENVIENIMNNLSGKDEVKETQFNFVEPFNMTFDLELCRLNIKSVPKIKLNGALPSLNFCVTPASIKNFMKMGSLISKQLATDEEVPAVIDSEPTLNESTFASNLLDSLGTSQPKIEIPAVLLLADFSVPSATIMLCKDGSEYSPIPVPVVLITYRGFCMQAAMTLEDLTLKSKLHHIQIKDMTPLANNNLKFHYLASSQTDDNEGDSDIVYLQLRSINKNSPDYQNIDKEVKFNFNTLHINSNRETLAELIFLMKQMSDEGSGQELKSVTDTDETKLVNNSEKEKTIELRISTEVKLITIALNDTKDSIALVKLSQSAAVIDVSENDIIITGHLGHLALTNLESNSHFRNIIEVPHGEQIIQFTYRICDHHSGLPNVEREHILDMHITAMKFLWVHQFIEELLDYRNVFELILNAVMTRLYSSDPYLTIHKYRIECKQPKLVLAQLNSNSNIMVANLGSIIIQNSFEMAEGSNIKEITQIETEGANIKAAYLTVDSEWIHFEEGITIIHDCDFLFLIKQPFDQGPLQKSTERDMSPSLSVIIRSPQIRFLITQSTVLLLLDILKHNFIYIPSERQIQHIAQEKLKVLLDKRTEHTVFSLRVKINELFVDLCDDDCVPIICFRTNNFDVSIKNTSADNTTYDLELSSLVFTDKRQKSNVDPSMRDFIAPIENGKGKLVLKYTTSPDNSDSLDSKIDEFRFVVIPGVVLVLMDFGKPLANKLLEIQQYRDSVLYQPEKTEDVKPIEQKPGSFIIKFIITKQQVMVPEDVSNPLSRAILANANAVLNGFTTENKQKMNLACKQIEFFRANMKKEEPLTILEPFDANFDYFQNDITVKYTVSVDSIKMTLSYEDVKMVVGVVYQYLYSPSIPVSEISSNEKTSVNIEDTKKRK